MLLNSLSMPNINNEVYAAISLALHEYYGNTTHDEETGVITIKNRNSDWESHTLKMRQQP